ncbi:alanine racemase [Salinibacterium sp. ZJ450]|uniref:alanine racemase n=1 Tax=Salinibacterium sp. ZJ450 TaxID=2708338 RepID=UPI00142250BC|nr:alanine racemase [Salinibacterium sp. ZJ450]
MLADDWSTALKDFLVIPAVTDKNYTPALTAETRGDDGWRVAFDETATPVLTLDVDALAHNVGTMQQWMDARGLLFAPHGKTTMAPALWSWQLDAGAWGITVANEAQLRVAIAFGVRRVLLANEFVSPRGLAWLAGELASDPALDVVCWVDSLDGVALMTRHLQGATRPLGVCVELGAEGARGGARSQAAALEIAAAVRASGVLQLRGIAGYEGNVPGADADAKLLGVRQFLEQLTETFTAVLPLVEAERPLLTAGGSAYFDLVAEAFAPVIEQHPDVDAVLRSGAYIIHDDGMYRRTTPSASRVGPEFRAAAHVWARVISTPEPGLALLDAGKRDLSYDSGLPEVQQVFRHDGAGHKPVPVGGLTIVKTNDQHAYVSSAPVGGGVDTLRVGDLVQLGLSHPCTIFDKWRTALLLESTPDGDPTIRGAIATYF